jgi:AAA15 family ATPase/GTPase
MAVKLFSNSFFLVFNKLRVCFSLIERKLVTLNSKSIKNELENNFTAIPLSTGKTLDVLNSVVIYGANASGKSNLIKALRAINSKSILV